MADTPFEWAPVLETIIGGEDLSRDQARAAMVEVMNGRATDAQTAGFIVAMRAKGETVDEMAGFVEAMRSVAVTVDVGVPVVDLVGTGGDGFGTFNISTTAAFIAAGAGVKIAKHGNRAASSKTGSADLLEELGMQIQLPPEAMAQLVREIGFGFFFAPLYHPAMRHAGPVRKELKVRTVFNFLGPLCNPAGAQRVAIGVSDPQMAERMIGVLQRLGTESAFVFFGEDGMDELTLSGTSYIYRLRGGDVTHAEFTPADFGMPGCSIEDVLGGDAATNAAITRAVLAGEGGPRRNVAIINAAAAIVAAGLADGFVDGAALAAAAIDSGDAAGVAEAAIQRSGELATMNKS